MAKVSVLIPSYNSEKHIRPTLESVKWAEEILVCDSFSTDQTLSIAKEYGARIIQHEYINSARQKNWAIPQAKHEWILIVDTDEVLDSELQEEIKRLMSSEVPAYDGYKIARKNFIYGKWVRFGGIYPDYQLRLFRKEKGLYQTREVHAHVNLQGKQTVLKGHFLHDGFKDIKTWFIKTERYLRYETDEFEKNGEHFRLVKALFFPPLIFIRHYFLELGFLEGFRGFLLAVLDSFYYFMIYARLYEREAIHKTKRA